MNDQPTTPGGPGGPDDPSIPRFSGSISTASDRIQVIIEAAERAAAGIIEDAEAQARYYVLESRKHADQVAAGRSRTMCELTDSLIQRAEAVKAESDELIAALDSARTQLQEEAAPPQTDAPESSSPTPPAALPDPPPMEPLRSVPPLQSVDSPQAPESSAPADPSSQPPPPSAPVAPPAPAPEEIASASPPEAPIEVPQPPPMAAPPAEPDVPEVSAWARPESDDPPLREEPPPPPPPSEPSVSEPPQTEQSLPQTETHSSSESRDLVEPSAGARLLATQMAVAGSSREEIESRLQNEFGIPDSGPMLDSILGPR